MTVILYILLAFALGSAAGHRYARRSPGTKTIDATIPLAQIVADFREFSMLVEGGALSTEAEGAIRILEAHAQGKKLIEAPPKAKMRPLLEGEALAQFEAERAAIKGADTTSAIERGNLHARWHKKGYRFPLSMRKLMLDAAIDKSTREIYCLMFDEQDQPLPTEPPKKVES